MNITIEFNLVEVWHQVSSQTNNFDFSDQIFPERVFSVQSRNSGNYHRIQDIRISLDSKFHLKQTILIFWINFAQTVFSEQIRKSEHHHRIQHIRIISDAKFQLTQTTFVWTNLSKKGRKNIVYRK